MSSYHIERLSGVGGPIEVVRRVSGTQVLVHYPISADDARHADLKAALTRANAQHALATQKYEAEYKTLRYDKNSLTELRFVHRSLCRFGEAAYLRERWSREQARLQIEYDSKKVPRPRQMILNLDSVYASTDCVFRIVRVDPLPPVEAANVSEIDRAQEGGQ